MSDIILSFTNSPSRPEWCTLTLEVYKKDKDVYIEYNDGEHMDDLTIEGENLIALRDALDVIIGDK